MKKYFVFSDIHGNLKPLIKALDEKGFELENKNHILLSLGDHFDRGVENLAVLGFLKLFDKKNRLIMIKGNHDDFLRNFLTGKDNGVFNIKYNGMGNTLIEFADEKANTIEKIRNSILQKHPYIMNLLDKMVDKFELGKYEFIHAGYTFDESKGWYIDNFAKTPHFINTFDPQDKIYVFGHWHVQDLNFYGLGIKSNLPFRIPGFIGIDAKTIVTKQVNVLVFDAHGNELSTFKNVSKTVK